MCSLCSVIHLAQFLWDLKRRERFKKEKNTAPYVVWYTVCKRYALLTAARLATANHSVVKDKDACKKDT